MACDILCDRLVKEGISYSTFAEPATNQPGGPQPLPIFAWKMLSAHDVPPRLSVHCSLTHRNFKKARQGARIGTDKQPYDRM